MELGLYTFGDIVPHPGTGQSMTQQQRMAQLLDMARQAEQGGLDVFAVGEHHTPDFIASSPATVLAACAAVTHRVRLSSAVTLISAADPLRTYQEFATVDLISGGRAELIFGRGVSPEVLPLYGYRVADYDDLFMEKLELFRQLNTQRTTTWSGRYRSALRAVSPSPRPVQARLPLWIGAVSPASVRRAGLLGLPLALPMLGGTLPVYAQLAALYRQSWSEAGHDPAALRLAAFSHLHVAATSQAARDEYHPHYSAFFAHLAGRGGIPRAAFEQMSAPDGALMLGSPQEVIDRLMRLREATGIERYLGQIDIGGQSPAAVATAIELFAGVVAPALKRATAPAHAGPQPAHNASE